MKLTTAARLAGLAAVALLVSSVGPGSASATVTACSAPANEIVAENCKVGSPPSEWDVNGAGDALIQGYATSMSVNRGQQIGFKVKTAATDYRLDIYRLGYYGGLGARKVATVQPGVALPQRQPACVSDQTTGLNDCGSWKLSAGWAVPANAVSGVYVAKLVREDPDNGRASHIPFVVRDDSGRADLLFQTSDTTWQAYNEAGGNSLYVGQPAGRAYKVSYNRPLTTRGEHPEDAFFNAEFPMVRWLEANGYDVSYQSGIDTDRRGALLQQHEAFLSVGHDEYWSAAQRANVEAARDAGVDLAFFSGNEIFWKTRWEPSIGGKTTPYRTLVSYKETMADAMIDPQDPPTWTGTWRDPRFSPPADGGRPENALSGTIFTVNSGTFPIEVPAADGKLRFWRNTSVATLAPGAVASLTPDTLGYEWDEDLDNGFRPAGLIRLSTTTHAVPELLQDYGSTYAPGIATHHLTLYRAPSGALVFGAGTVQWSWGLDGTHDRGGSVPDPRIQQATLNLLADMGAQPGSRQPGLVPATASTDTTPAAASVSQPSPGATVPAGVAVTVSGTASDLGGVVGGVEVSVDGGQTWHPADGRASWTYRWTPTATGQASIRARATDDSANRGAASAAVPVTVVPRTCPCTIFGPAETPQDAAANDGQPIETGVKLAVTTAGSITGLRYYKGAAVTGVHVGHLWSASGQLLATATFTQESVSGWQLAQLANPVPVQAGVTYIASYYSPDGFYAFTANGLSAGAGAPPLRALADGDDGPNGVYHYGGGFPTDSFQASNYWADVVFVPVA